MADTKNQNCLVLPQFFICVASLQNSPLVGRNESGIILD